MFCIAILHCTEAHLRVSTLSLSVTHATCTGVHTRLLLWGAGAVGMLHQLKRLQQLYFYVHHVLLVTA